MISNTVEVFLNDIVIVSESSLLLVLHLSVFSAFVISNKVLSFSGIESSISL